MEFGAFKDPSDQNQLYYTLITIQNMRFERWNFFWWTIPLKESLEAGADDWSNSVTKILSAQLDRLVQVSLIGRWTCFALYITPGRVYQIFCKFCILDVFIILPNIPSYSRNKNRFLTSDILLLAVIRPNRPLGDFAWFWILNILRYFHFTDLKISSSNKGLPFFANLYLLVGPPYVSGNRFTILHILGVNSGLFVALSY